MSQVPTNEEIAKATYEFMRERYGKQAFRPWEELHDSIRDHYVEQTRVMREAGAVDPAWAR